MCGAGGPDQCGDDPDASDGDRGTRRVAAVVDLAGAVRWTAARRAVDLVSQVAAPPRASALRAMTSMRGAMAE